MDICLLIKTFSSGKKMINKVRLKAVAVALLVHVVSCRYTGDIIDEILQGDHHYDFKDLPADLKPFPLDDPDHGVKMGIPFTPCDDGVHGIELDWDPRSEAEIKCLPSDDINNETRFIEVHETKHEEPIHVCLNTPIRYKTPLPLSGSHRPLWPMFGEYKYLPPQRWVHSLEHGAVVLLYHPCMADKPELAALRSLVRDCLGKHIITPYRHITRNMPYALLTYEHGLLIGLFRPTQEEDVNIVVNFIKAHALDAPEAMVFEDGQYSKGLMESATKYSDLKETRENVCAFLR